MDIKIENKHLFVHCDQNQRHDLFDGAVVRFSEVQGMVEMNGPIEFKVESLFFFFFFFLRA